MGVCHICTCVLCRNSLVVGCNIESFGHNHTFVTKISKICCKCNGAVVTPKIELSNAYYELFGYYQTCKWDIFITKFFEIESELHAIEKLNNITKIFTCCQ